jgi:hypothetical protein
VRARLRKLAGPLKSTAPTLRAEVSITRNDDGGLHLRLLVRSGSLAGERNMDGKSCSALAGAAAVTLVLLLQSTEPLTENDLSGSSNATADSSKSTPNAQTISNTTNSNTTNSNTTNSNATNSNTPKQTPARPPATALAASEQHPAPRAVPEHDQRPERAWHVLLQLPQVELGVGPLHQPSLGLAVSAGASFASWRFLAKGSLWFPQHASADNGEGPYGADIHRMTATLLTCRTVVRSWFELSPCVSLAVQHVSARGTGSHVGARTGTVTWFGVGVGAQGGVHLAPWLTLFLGLDAQLQMSQPLLSVDEIGPVERLLPAALTTTLGSEWIF